MTAPKTRATTCLRNRTMKGTAVGGGGKTGREKTGTGKRTGTLAVAAPAAEAVGNTSSRFGMTMTTTTTTMMSTIETRDTRRPQVATRHPVPAITSLHQDMEHPHMRPHLGKSTLYFYFWHRFERYMTSNLDKAKIYSGSNTNISEPITSLNLF